MDTPAIKTFLKEKVGAFHDFSAERLQPLVEDSRVGSFEANEAVGASRRGSHALWCGLGAISVSALGDGGTRQSSDVAAATRLMRWR
jgi:hypothetical protein